MNVEDEPIFGQLVRERRHALGLTQEELAHRAGCATISVRRIEAGSLRPSTQLAEQLADVLAIPAEECDKFIRMARSVTNGKSMPQENSNPIPEPGMDGRMWRQTEYLLTLLPLIFLVLVLIINPSYIGTLAAIEPPFVIVNVLPCGWLVFAIVFALMMSSKFVLQNGRRGQGKRQVYYRTGLNGFVLLFLTFPALLLLLLAPALFQLLRSPIIVP